VAVARPDHRLVVRLFRAALNRFLLLPLGAVIALVWANTDPEPYFRFAHGAAFYVNEIGMAFFLALIAQELYEALMPHGELHRWHHWGSPVLAALGGIAGTAAAYWLFISASHQLMLAPAWPVPVAVDLAAGYYVMRLIYPHRHSATAFVLLAAAVTDAIVMTVVTVQDPGFAVHFGGLGLLIAALAIAAVLRRRRVKAFWPYWLGCGPVAWTAFYWMGIHPALALVPIVPLLPHDARRREVFGDRLDGTPIHHAEHEWNGIAQVAVFLFGLVNAGVILKEVDTGTWAVLVAAILGRPAGMLIANGLAISAGFRLPGRMRWRDLVVAALAMTSGFTFALFVSSAALPVGAVAQQVTIGALATIAGGLLAIAAARLLTVGRFKPSGSAAAEAA
jgi:NhaA family Na+:H+ antiporter